VSEAVGWYAYGIVPARAELALDSLVGVDPQFGVEVVVLGNVAAVVSRVRLAEFGAAALERNLEDRAWLERAARAHDAVVTHALGSGAVVPLRLCSIFSSRDRLLSMLRQEEARLLEELRRVENRAEWAVKILADPAAVEAAVGAGTAAEGGDATSAGEPDPSSGRAYLARKRHQRSAQEEAQALIDAAVGEAHERLRRHACASAVLRPQNAELSGRRGRMVHNGAYLVDAAHAEEFASVAGELAGIQRSRGLQMELSGPWAPYNFVTTGRAES
jgi:hypothetical protein